MGNANCLADDTGKAYEDKGVMKAGMGAVGSDANSVSDEYLDLALKGGSALKQKVGLTFTCIDLPNLDRRSKTDAFVVLWRLKNNGQKEKLG